MLIDTLQKESTDQTEIDHILGKSVIFIIQNYKKKFLWNFPLFKQKNVQGTNIRNGGTAI